MYPCTALLLLCLFSTIITYILNHRWERPQEGWARREGCGSHQVLAKCSFPQWGHMTFLGPCLAFCLQGLGLENTPWGLSPSCPGASITLARMYAHRYLPFPLAL